jgi:ABC-type nitrate/sulfonate/bicarbonate transport system permease component
MRKIVLVVILAIFPTWGAAAQSVDQPRKKIAKVWSTTSARQWQSVREVWPGLR